MTAWVLLVGGLGAFAAFSFALVPRLTNVHFGDVEFTGWSGPLAERLLRGERPYVDFVLPIPPGSFAVLAALDRLVGHPLLATELALDAFLQGVMGILAYVMARAITSRRNAVFTALATLVVVLELKKECAYDHTAQAVAWASVACAVWGFLEEDRRRAGRLLAAGGALASLTLFFKQSTGIGCIVGYFLAFAYLAARDRSSAPRHRAGFRRFLLGLALGLFAVWLGLLSLGSTARAFFQAAFVDASALKGGTLRLVRHLWVYLFEFGAFPGSLGVIVLSAVVGVRLVARRRSAHLGDEAGRSAPFSAWEPWTLAVLVGGATALGVHAVTHFHRGYPSDWIPVFDGLKRVTPLALVATSAVVASHALARDDGTAEVRRGHAIDAALVVALAASLLHNTSAPEFRPYYDNNALIPLTLACLFVLFDRADLRPLAVAYLAALLGSAAGEKTHRAMLANTRVDGGYWSGLRVSERGITIAKAALAVRDLTSPSDTVLVLPEDLQIEALIGRPRPPLLGAVVFVDQYPSRLARDDVARLAEHPPKVIVVHPREEAAWQDFFRIWSGTSGAEQVIRYVLSDLLPARYDRVTSFETTFHFQPADLDVYVRRDAPALGGARW